MSYYKLNKLDLIFCFTSVAVLFRNVQFEISISWHEDIEIAAACFARFDTKLEAKTIMEDDRRIYKAPAVYNEEKKKYLR